MNRPMRQRGVALITAIAVVAIAVSTAAFLAFDQQISIRGSHNLLAHDQAMEYVHAAEGLAQIALMEDAARSYASPSILSRVSVCMSSRIGGTLNRPSSRAPRGTLEQHFAARPSGLR